MDENVGCVERRSDVREAMDCLREVSELCRSRFNAIGERLDRVLRYKPEPPVATKDAEEKSSRCALATEILDVANALSELENVMRTFQNAIEL